MLFVGRCMADILWYDLLKAEQDVGRDLGFRMYSYEHFYAFTCQ